jgi:hypothetical protein
VSRDVSERVMEKIRIEFKASRLGNKWTLNYVAI